MPTSKSFDADSDTYGGEVPSLTTGNKSNKNMKNHHWSASVFFKALGKMVRWTLVGFLCASTILVLFVRMVPPPTSAFMIKRQLEGLFQEGKSPQIHYRWVSWDDISPHMHLAVVASEDQKFPHHWGFDFDAIAEAIKEMRTRGRVRGASTITQQTAKNLCLWEGRSLVRKGIEAWLALLMELFLPKKRILEVYINIVEFGDGVYGVHAAATIFLNKEPSRLTRKEAALLAAVLPSPKSHSVMAPSSYIQGRIKQIEWQMNNLGSSHLKKL